MLKYADEDGPGLDAVFHALSDPARRAIVERLSLGPASVSELAAPLPMSLPAVHQHLSVLEGCGLVRSHKRGRVRTCQLQAAKLGAAEAWMSERRAVWASRLDRLAGYLERLPPEEADGSRGADEPATADEAPRPGPSTHKRKGKN